MNMFVMRANQREQAKRRIQQQQPNKEPKNAAVHVAVSASSELPKSLLVWCSFLNLCLTTKEYEALQNSDQQQLINPPTPYPTNAPTPRPTTTSSVTTTNLPTYASPTMTPTPYEEDIAVGAMITICQLLGFCEKETPAPTMAPTQAPTTQTEGAMTGGLIQICIFLGLCETEPPATTMDVTTPPTIAPTSATYQDICEFLGNCVPVGNDNNNNNDEDREEDENNNSNTDIDVGGNNDTEQTEAEDWSDLSTNPLEALCIYLGLCPNPVAQPTPSPTLQPTPNPTRSPTMAPTKSPTKSPTAPPTISIETVDEVIVDTNPIGDVLFPPPTIINTKPAYCRFVVWC